MKKIDLAAWDRREQFEFFSTLSNPFFNVSFNIDVTGLYHFCHARGLSFYYSLSFLCVKAMNSVENFRYVIKDGGVYLCDGRIASCTDLPPGSTNFHILTLDPAENLEEFCRMAKKLNAEQKCFIDMSKESAELVYISCLPKLEVSSIVNEMDFCSPEHRNDSVPRLNWGRYFERDGHKMLNMSAAVNHRLIDGYHVGLFAEKLEELLNDPEVFMTQNTKDPK